VRATGGVEASVTNWDVARGQSGQGCPRFWNAHPGQDAIPMLASTSAMAYAENQCTRQGSLRTGPPPERQDQPTARTGPAPSTPSGSPIKGDLAR
jgi:hypothetical protein